MPSPVRELLVVDLLGGIGDLLLALPAVHALAASHPAARLRVVTVAAAAPLLARDPAVAEVVGAHDLDGPALRRTVAEQLQRSPPDLAVSTTRHSGLAELLEASVPRVVTDLWRGPPLDELVDERFLRLLVEDGVVAPAHARTSLHVVLGEDERTAAAERLPAGAGPVVLLVEAGMAVKRWPLDRWRALVRGLVADGLPVVVAAADGALAARVAEADPAAVVLPPGSLRELAAALAVAGERGGVVVGGDTGPLRLAAGVGAPVVGIFGPTVASRYGPRPEQGVGLQGLPGCEVRRPTAITEQECWWSGRCPLTADTPAAGSPACLDDVDVAAVRAAVRWAGAVGARLVGDPAGHGRRMTDASTQGQPEEGAGLSATGRTADQFSPGDDAPGDTYGEPRGTGTEGDEVTSGEDREAAESSGETSGGPTAES